MTMLLEVDSLVAVQTEVVVVVDLGEVVDLKDVLLLEAIVLSLAVAMNGSLLQVEVPMNGNQILALLQVAHRMNGKLLVQPLIDLVVQAQVSVVADRLDHQTVESDHMHLVLDHFHQLEVVAHIVETIELSQVQVIQDLDQVRRGHLVIVGQDLVDIVLVLVVVQESVDHLGTVHLAQVVTIHALVRAQGKENHLEIADQLEVALGTVHHEDLVLAASVAVLVNQLVHPPISHQIVRDQVMTVAPKNLFVQSEEGERDRGMKVKR